MRRRSCSICWSDGPARRSRFESYVEGSRRMLLSPSASVPTRPRDTRMMRVALVGSPDACARLRADVDGAFLVVGAYPDLRAARAAAIDADAFLVAAESAGPEDPAY